MRSGSERMRARISEGIRGLAVGDATWPFLASLF